MVHDPTLDHNCINLDLTYKYVDTKFHQVQPFNLKILKKKTCQKIYMKEQQAPHDPNLFWDSVEKLRDIQAHVQHKTN